ncbi:MAG: hypothetical protein IK005_00505 [Paludibacteraceae bacterium]|nr:hypothetical protein [Paludibacteraceae bacterium]MBR4838938.1 hypothetical protein [Paludibacteraceae bacterium]
MRKFIHIIIALGMTIPTIWAQDSTVYKKKAHIYDVTLISNWEGQELTVSGKIGKHAYVDLGLPSGRFWATCNIGAKSPEESGDFFAWGEIKQKKEYNWKTYKWSEIKENGKYKDINGEEKTSYKKIQTKYCANSYINYQGQLYVKKGSDMDTLRRLLPEDDAATAQWGKHWRMPTIEEIEELIEWCDWIWVPNYNNTGSAGILGVSKSNQHSIFFPASGFMYNKAISEAGKFGAYWTSDLEKDADFNQNLLDPSANSMGFYFKMKWVRTNWDNRMFGMHIRAIAASKEK